MARCSPLHAVHENVLPHTRQLQYVIILTFLTTRLGGFLWGQFNTTVLILEETGVQVEQDSKVFLPYGM